MDEHAVTERLLVAYRLGLLDDASREAVCDHLATCDACSELETEIATRLGEDATVDRHVSPTMLVGWPMAVISLTGLERRAVSAHLRRCADCRDDLRRLGYDPVLSDASALEVAATSREPGWLARAVNAVAALPLSPLPVNPSRGAAGDEAEAAMWRGLDRYRSGDYAAAVRELAAAGDAAHDRPEVRLYEGSARLLCGDLAGARSALTAGASGALEGSRVEREIGWLLAMVQIASGRFEAAADQLRSLTGSGDRAQEARETLDALVGLRLVSEA